MQDIKEVAIVGVGLIGGSLGLAIKELSDAPQVVGTSRSAKTINKALEVEAIDKGTTSIKDAVANADIVFIATPISTIVDMIKDIAPCLKTGAIVTDVGSTKNRIVRSVEAFLPDNLHFIGGHPMAGSEQQGVSFATATLFKNSYYLLTPTDNTDTIAFKKLHSLLASIGSQVLAIDPEKHDKIVSIISHLPHILSASLVNLANRQTRENKSLLLIAAGGFRDMTRIAASDPNMWRDICVENSDAILMAIEEFRRNLDDFQKDIKETDREALWNEFQEAQSVRLNLPTILHKDISDFRELSIPVSDEPGVISSISVTIGKIGVNIEDIEIVHFTEKSGVIKLVVSGEKEAQSAAEALQEIGYQVEINKLIDREVP